MTISACLWDLRCTLPPGTGCWLPVLLRRRDEVVLAVPLYVFDLLQPRVRSPHQILVVDPQTGAELERLGPASMGLCSAGEGWLSHPRLFAWSVQDWSAYYDALGALRKPFTRSGHVPESSRYAARVVERSLEPLGGPLTPFVRALGVEFFAWLEREGPGIAREEV